jgi:hypothetical protein
MILERRRHFVWLRANDGLLTYESGFRDVAVRVSKVVSVGLGILVYHIIELDLATIGSAVRRPGAIPGAGHCTGCLYALRTGIGSSNDNEIACRARLDLSCGQTARTGPIPGVGSRQLVTRDRYASEQDERGKDVSDSHEVLRVRCAG